ncbi:hypothetical protein [Microbacterium sp.]|uniref:hypothetical protein n=2 Tax=Microbacterium sp. TaxID=51671 RepID=UPI003F9B6EFA
MTSKVKRERPSIMTDRIDGAMTEQFEVEPGLPQLVLPAPQCGHCGNDVELDGDGAWCEGCCVSWERIFDGDVGRPDPDVEGSHVPCTIVDKPLIGLSLTFVHGPCVLPSGHDGEHLCPYRREFNSAMKETDDD